MFLVPPSDGYNAPKRNALHAYLTPDIAVEIAKFDKDCFLVAQTANQN